MGKVRQGKASQILPEACSLSREVREKTNFFVFISFTLWMTNTLKSCLEAVTHQTAQCQKFHLVIQVF